MLVNARHVKAVPGRKTDVKDAQWLCQLLEAGLLKASFVPPKPIRTLRNLTRYRKTQIQDRQREAARLHKILEDTGIKLGSVATDILGKSGRDMLDALVSWHDRPHRARRPRPRATAQEDPRVTRSPPGPLRYRALADRRPDPRAHRLPRRSDRPTLRRDRRSNAPVHRPT